MKKIILLCSTLCFVLVAYSQDAETDSASVWKTGGVSTLNFSQVSFENWAAGGENSYSLNGIFSLHANYKKDRTTWENSLDIGYGIIKQGNRGLRKTDDKFEITSKYGYKSSSNWYYSGAFSFKTQFDKGYKYDDEAGTKTQISEFMAPAYMLLSVGMDYKPSDHFTLLISPVTGKSTFVLNDSLSNKGAFGVEPGEKMRNEFGGFLKIGYNKEIWGNVSLNTKIEFFSNYLEQPQNVDVNWEMLISMKINEYLSANLNTQLIYDDDINYIDDSGKEHGPRVQLKEVFGVGFSYKF
jgi:hypothetical protein